MFIVGRTSKREYSRYFHLNDRIVRAENMLFFGIFSALLAVASAESCYEEVKNVCGKYISEDRSLNTCIAKHEFSSDEQIPYSLQQLTDANIIFSYQFLLLSSYMGNYKIQREGFQKLYRKYSDEMWENAIDLIKYMAKRGMTMNFGELPHESRSSKTIELTEIESLALALDKQKYLAKLSAEIHAKAHRKDDHTAHYIEEKFFEKQINRIRDIAGYIVDWKNLLVEDNFVSLFLFDEYLQKSL